MIPTYKQLTPFLNLKTVQTDKFKTERFSVCIIIPPEERLMPVSRFVFHVLKRGCKKYPTQRELNVRLDDLYSAAVSTRFWDGIGSCKIGFVAEMLGDEYTDGSVFDGTVELLFDMLWEPLLDEKGYFTSKNVDLARENICDSIRSVINNPRQYALKRFWETMYEGDGCALPRSGTVELIESVSADELIKTYNDLVRNSSYEVSYIGSKSPSDVERIVKRYFEKFGYGKEKSCKYPVSFAVDTKKVKRVTETMKLSQGKLVMGYKSGVNITCGKDYYSLVVLNEIFGASPVSKLFMNVREKLGLCYYCSSKLDSGKGCIIVSSGIEKSDFKKAECEIKKQFSNIQHGKISELEFTSAIKSLLNLYSETTDSAVSIEGFYNIRNEYSIDDTIEDAKQKIREVTLDDVIRISKGVVLDTVYFLCGREDGDCDD